MFHVAVGDVVMANRICMFGNVQDCVPKKFGMAFLIMRNFLTRRKLNLEGRFCILCPSMKCRCRKYFKLFTVRHELGHGAGGYHASPKGRLVLLFLFFLNENVHRISSH